MGRGVGAGSFFAAHRGTYKSLVALAIASLLIGSVAVVAPARRALASGSVGSNTIWYVGPGTGGSAPCDAASLDFTTGVTGDGSDAAAIQAAVNQATTGDVIFLCDAVYDLGATITLSTSAATALTFQGESTTGTSISGGDAVQLIDATGKNLTLVGLTLRNGSSSADGGAVSALTVTASGAVFAQNVAVGGGGAIWATTSAVVSDSRFEDNTAGSGGGGAIGSSGAVTSTSSDFYRNAVTNEGGGAIAGDTGISVLGGTFDSNEAFYSGGALYAHGTASVIAVTDGTFIANTSTDCGGALSAYGGYAIVDGGSFTGNSMTDLCAGGAIWAELGLDVTAATFTGNRSVRGGGAIALSQGALQVRDSRFIANIAVQDGGAIVACQNSDTCTPVVTRSTFEDNSAGSNGGAIQVYGSVTTHVTDSSFYRNTAGNDGGGIGAGLAAVDPVVEVIGSTFAANRAGRYGGGIAATTDLGGVSHDVSVTSTNSTFFENTAGSSGGAISAVTGVGTGSVTVKHSTLVSNAAPGAGHVETHDTLDVYSSIFNNGTCSAPTTNWYGRNFGTSGSCLDGVINNVLTLLELQPLADNGGPTQTMALGQGSIATDPSGENCYAGVDQRGVARTVGTNCDSGAYEWPGTTISSQLYLNGVAIANGAADPAPAGSDTVDDHVQVAGGLGYAPGGTVTFFLCRTAAATCTAGTQIGGPVSLTDGTNPSDDVSEAWLTGWAPDMGWRPGSYVLRAVYEPSAGTLDASVETGNRTTQSLVIGGQDYWVGDGAAGSGRCLSPDFSSGGAALTQSVIQDAADLASVDGYAFNTIHLCPGRYDFTDQVAVAIGDSITGLEFRGEGTGRGHVLLDATGGSDNRHFDITSVGSVTFTNLTLTNGKRTSQNGGSIRSTVGGYATRLYFDHVDVTSNTVAVTGLYGGAVFTYGDVFVTDSTFQGNRAIAAGGGDAAISAQGSVSILRSSFIGNIGTKFSAIDAGGAVSITDGILIGNAVTSTGSNVYAGAVYSGGVLTVVRSEVSGNTGWKGGALYADDDIVIVDVSFTGNTGNEGAAIYGYYGNISISDATFTGNVASKKGGAIYANKGDIYDTGEVSITDATFTANGASTYYRDGGGAIYARKPVTILRSGFTENTSGTGGAIFTEDAISVSDATFTRNTGQGGGAIAANGPISITDGSFIGNSTGGSGGAISGDTTRIERGTFTGNTAVGGSYTRGGAISVGNLVLIDVDFSANSANIGGAVSVVGDATVSGGSFIDNTTVTSFVAPQEGGAIHIEGSIAVSDGTVFDGNQGTNGGAIYAVGSVSSSDGTYLRNVATTGHGGAIFAEGQPVSSTREDFSSNTAAGAGGAIYAIGGEVASTLGSYSHNIATANEGGAISADTVSSNADTFVWNAAGNAGGAIFAGAGSLTVTDGTFTDNAAPGNGGAIYAGSTAAIVGSDLRANTSLPNGHGGAVYAFERLSIYGTSFVENTAGSGGAIAAGNAICCANTAGIVEITGATFYRNSADQDGGAIFVIDGTSSNPPAARLTLDMVDFTANTANGAGGGAAVAGDLVSREVSFLQNDADGRGGAVDVGGSTTIADGNFVANHAGDGGGAINGFAFDLTDVAFTDNTSGEEAGAIWGQGLGSIVRGRFERNVAGFAGGAVFSDGDLSIVDSTFVDNLTDRYGGAIYDLAGTMTITGSTFARNGAARGDGAIAGDAVVATNSTFVENSAGIHGANATGGAIGATGVSLTQVTLVDNTASTSGSAIKVFAGGLVSSFSLFASGDCDGVTLANDGNVTTDASCTGTVVTRAALKLGAFANHDGTTDTVELLPGSAAIDPAASAPGTTLVDQRGLPRPKGVRNDAGAYERQTVTTITILGPTSLTEGDPVTFVVSVSSGDDEVTGGTLSLSDGARALGSCELTAGTHGTCEFSSGTLGFELAPGTRPIVATYSGTSGDVLRDPARTVVTVTVAPTPKADYYVGDGGIVPSALPGGKGGIRPLLSDCLTPGFTTIQEALDFAKTDGIPANTIHVCPGRYVLSVPLTIETGDNTAGLTIEGDTSTNTIIDGAGVTSLVGVFSGDPLALTFRKLTLTRGWIDSGYGAAIHWNSGPGELALDRVDVTGNTITVIGSGGAVWAGSIAIAISGSHFADNHVPWEGGAVYAPWVTVADSTFEANTAVQNGGAIRAAELTAATSVFRDNTAGDAGGAFYVDNAYLSASHFMGNGAVNAGGAIYASAGVSALATDFIDNTVATYGGGAIASSTVAVTDGSFAGNRAGGSGGAISTGNADITGGTTFDDNGAGGDGGAMTANTADLRDVTFTDNTAATYGGAVSVGTYLDLTRATFDGNHIVAGGTGNGGAVSAGLTTNVVDSVFTNNSTVTDAGTGSGGAIYAVTTDVNATGSRFEGNSASVYGGAIYAGAVVLDRTELRENTAGQSGGAIGSANVRVGRSTFADNSAGTDGGAIVTPVLDVTASTFYRNVATEAGGAVSALTNVDATNVTFNENSAGLGGGAIVTGALTVVHVTFLDDTAASGGLVYADFLTATDSIFAGGTCTTVGASPNGLNFATDSSCPNAGTTVTKAQLDLGTLRMNGGPTPTIALGFGSVALEPSTGTVAPCASDVDQRGVARPQGSFCDPGAYERGGITKVVLQTLDNPINYGAPSPRFRVTVTTGDGVEVTSGTITLYETSTGSAARVYWTCTLALGMGGSCGDLTTGIDPLRYYVGRHPLLATYTPTDPDLTPSRTTGDQYVVRNGVALLYTGVTYFVPAPATGRYPLQATLTPLSGGSVCANKKVDFYLGASDGTYPTLLGSAMTDSSGVAATDGTLTTGISEILVSFKGDGGCEPAVNTATILSDASGGTSSGGGHYTVPGVGKVNVAYTVSVGTYKLRGVDYTTVTGNLTWHTNGKFRLKGAITGYTQIPCPGGLSNTPICAYVTGAGTLSMWLSLSDGTSRWVPIATGVGFQSTVGDGGEPPLKGNGKGKGGGTNSKTYTDWFRMNIPTAVILGETTDLVDLKGGNIVVR